MIYTYDDRSPGWVSTRRYSSAGSMTPSTLSDEEPYVLYGLRPSYFTAKVDAALHFYPFQYRCVVVCVMVSGIRKDGLMCSIRTPSDTTAKPRR